jgi:hypothetical protein
MNPPPTAITSIGNPVEHIGNLIRHWVFYDTKISDLNKQIGSARSTRNTYETEILQKLRENKIINPVIQTAGGRLIVSDDKHTTPLTFTNIESLLHKYYARKPGAQDETNDILKFIKANRETTITQCLKRQGAPRTRNTT